jgi:NAD(P)H-quinone oxidoreductase subunit 5
LNAEWVVGLTQQAASWSAAARAVCLLLVPLVYGVSAMLASLSGTSQDNQREQTARRWAWAERGAIAALVMAAVSMLLLLLAGRPLSVAGGLFSADALACTVLLLVGFIGWVIVRYSRTCLLGEANQARFRGWLMLTLATVSLVVISNHLAVLAVAWFATSVALHQLLVFYGNRRPALVAAHKKFLASRLADLFLAAAVVLIASTEHTLFIDQIGARAQALAASGALPWPLQSATVLIVLAALLKCAQLPVHGWLIQVMEAPTPVSALLHAGVVNLGGFVLIRISGLLSEVPAAQTLLVVVGSTTAVLAALVMMTRISVKVMLAWSTCAQMGFMLMQCGLGAYELALLHLVGHSLYKAHAFLGAGGAVEQARLQRLSGPAAALTAGAALSSAFIGLLLSAAAVAGAALLWGAPLMQEPVLWVLTFVVCLALVPLLSQQALKVGGLGPVLLVIISFAVASLYFALHHFALAWFGAAAPPRGDQPLLWLWVVFSFGALFVLQTWIRSRPQSRLSRRLYPWFYAGLYLDEWFTRLSFRVWPVRLGASSAQPVVASKGF